MKSKNCQKAMLLTPAFRIVMINTMIAAFVRGRIVILPKLRTLHAVVLMAIELKPIAEKKVLISTAIAAPEIPQRMLKGYIIAANTNSRTICHIVSNFGFPTPCNMGLAVAVTELTRPATAKI